MLKQNNKAILSGLVVLFVVMIYSSYLKSIIVSILFIFLSGISKIYHRYFKSTIGIDFICFLTLMISLVYNNILLSFLVGFAGLIIADVLGTRLSHTSLVSMIGITAIILASGLFNRFPLTLSLVVLTLAFEIISVIFYNLLGSSPDKIIIFFVTHFAFNMFLIFTFSGMIATIMI
ncbi:MAG: hypothetical protein ABIJ34_01020 [archaeon]